MRRNLTTNTGSNNRGRDPLDRGLMAALRDLAVAKLALTGALAVRTGDGPHVVESAGLDDTLSSTVALETLPRALAERARPRFLPLGLSVVGQGVTPGNLCAGVMLGQAAASASMCPACSMTSTKRRVAIWEIPGNIGAMASVEDKVKHMIVEQLGVDEDEVKAEASFVDDLGADSLDVVELVMALEEEFSLEISDEDAEKLTTVEKSIGYIKEHAKS